MRASALAMAALLVAVAVGGAGAAAPATGSAPFNITKVLGHYPEYSDFNHALSRTKLADEINSRQTITVLALSNGNMAALRHMDLQSLKHALSLHVVLDYFDPSKLHDITNGTALTTTLYQTTGNAAGNGGFINITDLKGGKVAFGPATKGAKLGTTYVKSVKQIGYNLSVIEVSAPIETTFVEAPSPAPSDVNLTAVLDKGGCKVFAGLLASSGALKTFQDNVQGGLTVFAPSDEAFSARRKKAIANLSASGETSLLEYHGVPEYSPLGTLKISNKGIGTLASNGKGTFTIKVSSQGNTVFLNSGITKATISDTLLDDQPLAVFSINEVLEPTELFSLPPAPAPAPATVEAPAPSAPVHSPPAPPSSEAPGSEVPSTDGPARAENSKSGAGSSSPLAGFLFFCVVASGLVLA